ncbi:unnamed protein product, partial [Pylaiella littoralis]
RVLCVPCGGSGGAHGVSGRTRTTFDEPPGPSLSVSRGRPFFQVLNRRTTFDIPLLSHVRREKAFLSCFESQDHV